MADNTEKMAESLQVGAQAAQIIRQNISDASAEAKRFGSNMSEEFSRIAKESRTLFDASVLGRFKNVVRAISENFEQLSRQIRRTKTSVLAFTGAVGGLAFGIGQAKTLLTALGGAFKLSFNIARTAIGALTRTAGLFFSFFSSALNGGGGSSGLFEALQEFKREFGSLRDVTGQAMFEVVNELRRLPRNLEGVGILLADTIKNATKYVDTLGPLFAGFMSEFTYQSEVFRAGLGLTDDMFRQLVADSRATGESFNEVGLRIARVSGAIGSAVGVSQKIIAKELVKARSNIKIFGDITDEEIGLAIGRFQSLGLEVENVLGLFETFKTFESAADAVSQLSAAFGVQLDVFRLVNEDNPAQTLDYLRQQFALTGRTVESLSRRELSLLSSTLNIGDESLTRLAFSSQNAGMSLDEIRRGAEASGEATKSLEEVLQDLVDAIARTRMQGQQFNSFLEAMNAGIARGIRRFLRSEGVLRRYRRALRETYRGFSRLTRAVLEAIPGMDDFTAALREIFDPRRFRRTIDAMKDAIVDLVESGGTEFNTFAERVSGIFKNTFADGGEIIQQFKRGGLSILLTLGNVLREGFVWLSEKVFGDPQNGIAGTLLQGLTRAMTWLAENLKSNNVSDALRNAGNFAKEVGGGIFAPIVEFFQSPEAQAMFGEIWSAFKDIISTALSTADSYWRDLTGMLLEKIGWGFLTNAQSQGPGFAQTLVAIIFGPAIFGAAAGAALKAVFTPMGMAWNGIIAAGKSIGGGLLDGIRSRWAASRVGQRLGADIGSLIERNVTPGANMRGARSATASTARNAAATTGTIGASAGGARATASASRISLSRLLGGAAIIAAFATFLAVGGYFLIKAINNLPVDNPRELRSKVVSFSILVGVITAASIAIAAMGAALAGPQMGLLAVGIGAIGVVGAAIGLGIPALINHINNLPNIRQQTFTLIDKLPRLFTSLALATVGIATAGSMIAAGSVLTLGLVNPLKRGIKAMEALLEGVQGTLENMVSLVQRNFSRLTQSQADMVDRGMRIVVSFIEVLSPFMDDISRIVRRVRPGLFRGQEARTAAVTATIGAVSDFVLDLLKEGIPTAIDGIMSSIRGISFSEGQLSALSGVGSLIGAISTLISSLGPVLSRDGGNSNVGRRFGWQDYSNLDLGRLESIADIAPVVVSTIKDLLRDIGPSMQSIVGAIDQVSISDPENLEAKMSVVSTVFDTLSTAFDLAATVSERFGQSGGIGAIFSSAAVTRSQTALRASTLILAPFSDIIGSFGERLPEDAALDAAVARLDAIQQSNVIAKLENFFEQSGGLFDRIRSNSIVDLGEQAINNAARILPAVANAVRALETEGAQIVNDNLRVAVAGTTFDITIILEVDGEELGRVAARETIRQG